MSTRNRLVQVNIPNIATIERQLGSLSKKTPNVLSKAINRTITHVVKTMSQEARKNYIVKAGDTKKAISVRKSNRNDLRGLAIAKSKEKVPLMGFKASPTQPRQANPPRIYKSQVRQDSRLKALTGSEDRSKGFVAVMDNGHKGLFQRKGTYKDGKEQIAELYGLSVPHMFSSKKVSQEVIDDGKDFLARQIDSEVNRLLRSIR